MILVVGKYAEVLVRLWLFLKRYGFNILLRDSMRGTSLRRSEQESHISFRQLETYSDSSIVEIFDPRDRRVKGHFFNERDVMELARVILEPRQSLLYSERGNLIEESTNWPSSFVFRSFPWRPSRLNKKQLSNDDAVIFLSGRPFWHWLLEDLPSVYYLAKKFPGSPILVPKAAPKYVQDFGKCVNNQIITLEYPQLVQSVIMVTKQKDSGWPHPKDIEILKSLKRDLKASTMENGKRIYISRRFSTRSPVNESQVEDLFREFNFEVIYTEKLDFYEEIRIFSQASVVAGIHGAGLANMVWMERNGVVLDLIGSDYWTESPHRAASMLGLDYRYFVYGHDGRSEVVISELKKFLETL